jgi:hypothetical protein
MKKIISISIIFGLFLISLIDAKQTFYNSLDSQEAVEAGDGTVHGGSFEPAIVEGGFLADEVGEAVSFPTEGVLKLAEGTIALWVKVMFPILDAPKESFIFLSYLRGNDAWFINHSHAWQPNGICWMIKNNGVWHEQGSSCSKDLDWKEGEGHFIACTWGEKMELYLDGDLAAEVDFKGGPAQLDDDFWVGNIDIDTAANPDLYSKWIQDELYIFDNQLSGNEVNQLMKSSLAVESKNSLASTWGKLKSAVLASSPGQGSWIE